MAQFFQDLSTTDTLMLILISSMIILAVLVVHLEFKMKRVLRGKSGHDLEDTLMAIAREAERLGKNHELTVAHLKNIETRLKRSVQGVGTTRFTSFRNSGDGQSFATAILSEEGDGVIISTLSMRERTSIFAKPIVHFTPEVELTDEEKEALALARHSK